MEMLNPKVDFAFNKLFGSEENKAVLIAFINSIVDEKDRVKDVTLLNPYHDREHSKDRLSILDIKATDERGQYYNIEMQITDETNYEAHILYYWARLYTSQLKKGDAYENLRKTISINILNFNSILNESDYHNVFKLLNTKSHKGYPDQLEIHFIELQKFEEKHLPIKTALDRWVTFLTKASLYEPNKLPNELTAEPTMEQAFSSLVNVSLTDEEREIYEAKLKWLHIQTSAINKAHKIGHEEGIEKSMEEGMEEGVEKVAITMLENNLSFELIEQATGLTIAKIEALKERIKTSK